MVSQEQLTLALMARPQADTRMHGNMRCTCGIVDNIEPD
jgi:hypothetical protein